MMLIDGKAVFGLMFIVLVITALLSGCAHNRYLEIQCIDRPRPEAVEGPVIVDGDAVIYYDARNKLMKKSKETCGVKVVE